jgi:hypothetical protein
MQMEISREEPRWPEPDLARKLRQQVAERKTMRSLARSRMAEGVQVERRLRRRDVRSYSVDSLP